MFDNRNLPAAHLLHGKRIAIVGGGPAGLTLARLLQMRGVTVTVFERDASPTVRHQGGSMDLHTDSGQRALKAAGLEEPFRSRSRPEGQYSKVFDKHGVLHAEMRPEEEEESRPEIDRGDLRDLLLHSLEPDTIQWDQRLLSVTRTAETTLKLVFEKQALEVDLVLGCDGGWSKVRPLVTEVTLPAYTGVTFVQTLITHPDERYPAIAALVGPGSLLALGDAKGLLAQRNGDGSIRLYIVLRVAEDWAQAGGLNFADALQVRTELRKQFDDWAPEFQEMLQADDDHFQPWPLYTYPTTQTWWPRGDVTLLGDAAHIMPPFSGMGANYAMLDAIELADALTTGSFDTLPSALAAYEESMLDRMRDAIEETLATQEMLIAEDAPFGLIG